MGRGNEKGKGRSEELVCAAIWPELRVHGKYLLAKREREMGHVMNNPFTIYKESRRAPS